MINPNQKLNSKLFDKDCEQVPISNGLNANTWSIQESERDGARRGREIFQPKNICDLVKGLRQNLC
jgi:hypothetical protein